jgi:hypothetical protein
MSRHAGPAALVRRVTELVDDVPRSVAGRTKVARWFSAGSITGSSIPTGRGVNVRLSAAGFADTSAAEAGTELTPVDIEAKLR